MPRNPEQERSGELEPPPFLLSSRFESRESSQQPYDTIQAIVRDEDVADFSALLFIQNYPVDRLAIQAGRRTGFETAQTQVI